MTKMRQHQQQQSSPLFLLKGALFRGSSNNHHNRNVGKIAHDLGDIDAHHVVDRYHSGRDDHGSPVSVIAHSASAFSHPSSACGSMERVVHHFHHHACTDAPPPAVAAAANACHQSKLHLQQQPQQHSSSSLTSDDDHLAHPDMLYKMKASEASPETQSFPSKTWPHWLMSGVSRSKALESSDFNRSLTSETEYSALSSDEESSAEHCSTNLKGLQNGATVLRAEIWKADSNAPVNNTPSRKLHYSGDWAREQPHKPGLNVLNTDLQKQHKSQSEAMHIDKTSEGFIGRGRGTLLSKATPSKWEDAEKWLVNADTPSHALIKDGSCKVLHAKGNGAPSNLPSPSGAIIRRARDCSLSSGEILGSSLAFSQSQGCTATSDSELLKDRGHSEQLRSNFGRYKQQQVLQKHRDRYKVEVGDEYLNHGAIVLVPPNRPMVSNCVQGSNETDQGKDLILMQVGADKVADVQQHGCPMRPRLSAQMPKHVRHASMKDAETEISPSLSTREMGTQMTPMPSSRTSKSGSPVKILSPPRHNTPTRRSTCRSCNSLTKGPGHHPQHSQKPNVLELQSCHLAKLELRDVPDGSHFQSFDQSTTSAALRLSEDQEAKGSSATCSVRPQDDDDDFNPMVKLSMLEANAAAWEEAERVKCTIKYKREQARIEAWENLQLAKAEAELKKLEVKLERLRSHATGKIMSKLNAARRRAQEMRAAADAQQVDQMIKVGDRARSICKSAHFPGSFAVCFARVG